MAKWTNQNRAFCHYLIVIIFLSSRERFPILIRRWCRNRIGAFPLGLYLDGVSCFRSDFFGLQHHRDHDHKSPFSKLRECSQIQIWDPGDSNYISEIGGLRLLFRHTYGLLFEFVLGIGDMVLPRSQTSLFLCFDVCLVVLMHHSGLYGIAMSRLHVGLVYYWRQDSIGIAQICCLRKAFVKYRWESVDACEPETWIDTVFHEFPVVFGVKICTDVYGVKGTIGWAYTGATSLIYVIWSCNARMPERHTYHIRVRWNLKKEYIMFYNMIASKAYRKEASSISLFQLCPLQHMVHKSAYVKVCVCEFRLNTVVIPFI